MKFVVGIIFFFFIFNSYCQNEPQNGAAVSEADYYLLHNATIYVSPTRKLLKSSILLQGDKIVKVGPVIAAPQGAVSIDMQGKVIVPAFIELNSSLGVATPPKKSKGDNPQYESSKKGAYYWNEAIHPEINSEDLYSIDNKANKELIKAGYGFALTRQDDGISQGSGVFVSLGAKDDNKQVTNWSSTAFFSFKKGVSRQATPSSQMGSIALLRQAFYDAIWYKESHEKARNLSLEALNDQLHNSNLFFSTTDELEILRAEKIAKEFDLDFSYIGSGNEYLIAEDLSDLKRNVIIPIKFPAAFDVQNPYVARQIPLSDLKHWEMAPYNPMILANHNVDFCISSFKHDKSSEFWGDLRKALEHGLEIHDALRALTINPAEILGVDDKIGTLEKNKIASFMVYDKDPFKFKGQLIESWLLGKRNVVKDVDHEKIDGKFMLSIDQRRVSIEITGSGNKLKGVVTYKKVSFDRKGRKSTEEKTSDAKVTINNQDVNIQFPIDDGVWSGSVTLHGKVNPRLKIFEGEGLIPTGKWIKWTGIRKNVLPSSKEKSKLKVHVDTTDKIWYPNMAYGFKAEPVMSSMVIKNATLWTNEDAGIIENGTVVIENGKITHAGAGSYRTPSGAIVIDGKGKHITSGIIDEHSHIAISKGVNDGMQAISAEVSIGDVVNPNDINIYRQLSGGVTASQLLHGSANPIGGQSALVKLKWGHNAEEMLISDAPKFIKFALGENVKHSNWGNRGRIRFPQTRMGVEQLLYDGFLRAKAYEKELNDYDAGVIQHKPQVDLELLALIEILNGQRFISCHSYVQSEINMLMHVADSMNFRVNTFTHILEGYKVADKMKAHGAGGSTFSDWWAYKFEVNDAIPYNAALMHEQGIVVAINSDDAEMGRRLNQEAAKGVKYGGMTEEDAWKMVTLNPAKLLHLDDRMGSLKVGKDADVVMWTDNPLSILAKVEYTIVDGEILYDSKRDLELRESNNVERARLITDMLDSNNRGEKKQAFFKKKNGHYHCDTIGEELSTEENHH